MIEIKNLSFSYKGERDVPVFKDLSLSIPETGITAINAPSGVGKTTLLKLLAGLLTPDSGELPHFKKVSFVFQEQRLLPWYSALENIKAVVDLPEDEIKQKLNLFGIDEELFNKRPSKLSGGQRQRVSLVRALLFDGDILLLDEPFTGLDKDNREKVLGEIQKVSKKVPVILVSHIKEDVKIADKVIEI